jgi:hypothetical protein
VQGPGSLFKNQLILMQLNELQIPGIVSTIHATPQQGKKVGGHAV